MQMLPKIEASIIMPADNEQSSSKSGFPSKSKKAVQHPVTKIGPHGKDPILYDDSLKRYEAIFLYRLRSFVLVNSPDTLNFARNDIAGEKDEARQRKYTALLEQACAGKEYHAQALKQLNTEIEAIGIAYNSLFDTEQYR